MALRVAINGFGRIGRLVLRAIVESGRRDIEVVAVNDLGPVETNAHLLRYDSVHGRFPAQVSVDGEFMIAAGHKMKVTAIKNPAELPHKELDVDIALECTGIFTTKEKASAHLAAGAKRVLVSAPCDGADLTVVYGVNHTAENLSAKGAYELEGDANAKVTFLATGTEVSLAVEARGLLAAEGIPSRVVSMPSWTLFEQQSEEYRRKTLGPGTVKVAIEAACREGWDRYIGSELLGDGGAFVGMHSFGASGPYKDVYAKFGITADAAVAAAKKLLK